jgi:DNA-binding response OmpR family regulator
VGRSRVLVVEPSTAIRELESEILIRGGYYPCLAESLERALLQLAACQPHVVLTTHTLGDGTGVDLVRHMRETKWAIPVIGVTGRRQAREKFQLAGITLFLEKPFSAVELLAVVKSALSVVGDP